MPAATAVQVGVVEDDDRRLAAELEVDALQRRRGRLGDLLAGRDVARQRDHGARRVLDEARADRLAVARDDVEDARREDVGGELGQAQRRQRRLLGRLQDDRVAGRERRADLPDRPSSAGSSRARSSRRRRPARAGSCRCSPRRYSPAALPSRQRAAPGEEAQVVRPRTGSRPARAPIGLPTFRDSSCAELLGVLLDARRRASGASSARSPRRRVEPLREGVLRRLRRRGRRPPRCRSGPRRSPPPSPGSRSPSSRPRRRRPISLRRSSCAGTRQRSSRIGPPFPTLGPA